MAQTPDIELPKCLNCKEKQSSFICSYCGPSIHYCSQKCQKEDWPRHQLNCKQPRAQTSQQQSENQRLQTVQDVKYFTKQIYSLLFPVLLCILLSVVWIRLSLNGQSDYRPTKDSIQVFQESASQSTGERLLGSLTNAFILLAEIVVATFLFLLCFYCKWFKLLYFYLFCTIVLLLGFMGYLLMLNILQVLRFPMDYVTMGFCLWNFTLTGIVCVFWRGPLWAQQAYLIVMSSLMAFNLTGLQSWTTWTLLVLLALWGFLFFLFLDLIAVLCPYGPLNLLIRNSRETGNRMPSALLYSVGSTFVIMMADKESVPLSPLSSALPPLTQIESGPSNSSTKPLLDNMESRDLEKSVIAQTKIITQHPQPNQRHQDDDEEEENEKSGLKLGLGDFVFYSVLVSNTATSTTSVTLTWMTLFAVLTGMSLTIMVLAIVGRALPALPISIACGVVVAIVGGLVNGWVGYLNQMAIVV